MALYGILKIMALFLLVEINMEFHTLSQSQ